MKSKKVKQEISRKEKEKQYEDKQTLAELEQFYTTGKVDDFFLEINKRKNEITSDMINYLEERGIKGMNPTLILNMFLKPVSPIMGQEPQYSAEKLGLVYEYYCYIISEINMRIGTYPSSITSFCRLAGITVETLRGYKKSADYSLRVVANKIYEQISDENLTLSQMDYVKERTTLFKMKSQNELVEKVQPNVNINIVETPDFDRISERLDKYQKFASKKNYGNLK